MKPKKNFRKVLIPFLISAFVYLNTQPCYNQQFYNNQYAIVIGINDYMNSNFKDLSYARGDAFAIETLLTQLGFTVYSLYDRQATRTNIISLLEDRLAPRLTNNDAVLFFFAGHGTTIELGGKDWGYIIPSDGTDQKATYISMDQLRTLSEKMGNAKHQAFIMDCCYGGQLAMRNISPILQNIPNYLNEVSKRVCRQVITAGGKNQVVADGGYQGHSVFTGYLLKAIDEGMADFNKDGWITFNELTTFLIPAASSSIQTPGYATLPGHEQGEFLFRSDKTFVSKGPIEIDRLPDVESETKEYGTIRLCSYSSGDVYIDGKRMGHVEDGDVTDYYNQPIGEHEIEIRYGDKIGTRGVIVAKDKISQVSIQLKLTRISTYTPTVTLRNQPLGLNRNEVKSMLQSKNLFDRYENKTGSGITHNYESKTIGDDKIVTDNATGLMWQQEGSSEYMNYGKAQEWIISLNHQGFAGYRDWRLPTLEEGMSLMEQEKKDGLYINPLFNRTQRWIWTSDYFSGESSWVWVANFLYGRCESYHIINAVSDCCVRAVRSIQSSTE